jgi:hypothetical protein
MVVHYLYHLDYYSISTYLEDKAASVTSYGNGAQIESESHWKINGHDGHISDDTAPDAVPEPMEGSAAVESSKARKKKKRRKASVQSPTEGSIAGLKDSAVNETGLHDEQAAEEAVAAALEDPMTYSNLLIHAKVYALSKKYNVEGLKALALEKFEDEAKQNWATDDFLQAAKEVYTSTFDDDDRRMRDVITDTLYEHPELLDKKETQKVIKGLDLGFDLLMRVRIRGGFSDT